MTDAEFIAEVRRGLITIMRAVIRRYGLSWADFLPKEENSIIAALAANQTATRAVLYVTHREIPPIAEPG